MEGLKTKDIRLGTRIIDIYFNVRRYYFSNIIGTTVYYCIPNLHFK